MHHQAAATEDARSTRSSNSSLDLDEEDRRYLEALRDRDHVATRVSRHPLGLFSVVAFILQQMIGALSSSYMYELQLTIRFRDWHLSNTMDRNAGN
jgi:hypothetical protein